MSAPTWAVGMRRIAPGLYADQDRSIHLFPEEMCEALGYAATEENCQTIRELAANAAREIYGEGVVMIELTDEVAS